MSVLRNVNYMKRFVHHPCATPNPLILVELAFEAALPVLIELFSFQVVQLAMRVPKLIGGQKAPALPTRGVNPDRKPGGKPKHGTGLAGQGTGARKSFGERLGPNTFLFRMADLEQTALYWWMIADLATQFQARWTSLIYMHEKCPFDHQCYAEGGIISNFSDQHIIGCILPNITAGSVFSGGLLIQVRVNPHTGKQAEDFTISFDGDITRHPPGSPPPTGAKLALIEAQTGEVMAAGGSDSPPNAHNGRTSGGFYSRAKGGEAHSYALAIINDSPDTVGCNRGTLRLAGGFCVSVAPAIPFDASHLAGRIDPRPRPPR